MRSKCILMHRMSFKLFVMQCMIKVMNHYFVKIESVSEIKICLFPLKITKKCKYSMPNYLPNIEKSIISIICITQKVNKNSHP